MSKRREVKQRGKIWDFFFVYGHILLGSAIVAISFNLFLLPNKIASGGVSGLSTILNYVFGFEPAYTQWAFNIPLFILGLILLGGLKYGAKTIVGTVFLPFVVLLTRDWSVGFEDPLLGALFGGIGVGLGLGIVFRANASTGGTDLAAQIIQKFTGISIGTAVFLMDGLIVITSAVAFGLELALYALISLFVTGKTIDIVQMGVGYAKIALIISDHQDEVKNGILKEVDRGVTKLSGHGGYTNQERDVLMCVVNQGEVTKLKQIVKTIDPNAFVVVTNATEVLGEGFNRTN
ncbi:membrane protein [Alkalihalobacillus alcalophilus ATCC 27647 = CGMCC 1.3604]|uniref:Membrane protein n=1 Tax=Alkalihalobacillus alcalophilus ATCC 27647 = CGMCC 1.3604 TaxID=1218173 RepID=A0A094X9X1_ALKAL|nr:YitT family protein [Alkalihalobacillus alcalophilus]KGA95570.1 membrane protein [Alkalihalobacillus alcalophilus ATCC 27647 = CGMCC 1.3604]MED1561554.1 YitT family protein [Alkalihalobacillus alcalophilus]THG91742.1 membrane protein [Alkalihalobacillus alcalophilus ATCC 27647 = CGMCC 1.3604]